MRDKIMKINQPFVDAMSELKKDENKDTRDVFIKELINARLIIPAIIEPAPVDGKMPENAKYSFFSVRTKEGEQFLLLFSGLEELKAWDTEGDKQLILQDFEQYKNFVLQEGSPYDGFVIDTKGSNITIRKKLVEVIDSALKPMVMEKEKIVVEQEGMLEPSEYASPGLYVAVTETILRNEAVNAAWMMQVKRKGDKMPTNVIVVDFEKGADKKSIFNAIARAANDFLAPDERIGIMPSYDNAARLAIDGIAPFYLKGHYGVETKKTKSED